MAIRIKARSGESAEQMLRRFKKLCEKEGLTKEIKKRAYYEKPSERKQRALRKAIKRREQQEVSLVQPASGNNARTSNTARPMRGGSRTSGGRGHH